MADNCFVVTDSSILFIKPDKGVVTEIGISTAKFINHQVTSCRFVEENLEPSTNRADGKPEKQINLVIRKVSGKELIFKNIKEGYARAYPLSRIGL
ncbi:MAG: hypothetical protein WC470_02005 [Candidatus Paceibacterota bacterium]